MTNPVQRRFVDPESGEISLGAYLGVASLLRLPAVLFSRGYDFMDHQFQYVDPAYHIGLAGSWWQPHDYLQGLRSWVYPGMLAGVFRLIDGLGLHDPQLMMIATRFVHGVVGLVPLAALWIFVVRWKGWRGQTAFLLFAACNALSVYTSIQPTGPTFATGLAVTSVLLFDGPGRRWPFLSGLLLGLAFACRFQDAFFGPVLLASGLWQRRFLASAFLGLGAATTITVQGLVDLATWGSFLYSPFRYVAWNVLEGAASRYGEEPFWFYLPLVALCLVLVPPFLGSGARALADGARKLPIAFAASVVYVLLHTLVARKAPRFILPALVLILIVYAAALLGPEVGTNLRRWHRRVFLAVHALALVLASFWYPHRGPIEAAIELSRRADFAERLVIVDGEQDSLGGHYYLRRNPLDVELVERRDLVSWIRTERPPTPLYLLVARTSLDQLEVPPPYALTFEGYFTDWPDVKSNTRRFLYRLYRPSEREPTK